MSINMNIIAEEIQPYVIDTYIKSDPELIIDNVLIANSEAIPHPENSVIICSEDHKLPKTAEFVILRTDRKQKLSALSKCQYIQISDAVSEKEILDKVNELILSYRKWQNDLIYGVADQLSLSELCCIAAEKLRNPFAILGNSGRLIAWAGDIPEGYDNPIWNSLFKNNFPQNYDESEELTKEPEWWKYEEAVITQHRYQNKTYNALTKGIFLNNSRVANIGMTEAILPFSEAEKDRVSFLADQILRRYFALHNDNEESSSLWEGRLLDTINGIRISDETLDQWESSLNNKERYYLFFIRPKNEEISSSRLLYYVNLFRRNHSKDELAVGKHGGLVILSKADDQSHALAQAHEYISNISDECCAGISQGFIHFKDAATAYQQSLYAFNRAIPIACYQDVALKHMTDMMSSEKKTEILISSDVRLLHEYDLKHNTEMLKTANLFYQCAGSKSQTAAQLYIHRNTLESRLARISEILGRDFVFRIEDQLYFMLSCMLMENQK